MTADLLPYSADDERALLGAIFLCGTEGLETAFRANLEPCILRDERHQRICRSFLRQYSRRIQIDMLSTKRDLAENGELETVGAAYLADTTTGVPTALNIEAIVERIIRDYRDRQLISVLSNALQAATHRNGGWEAARADLEKVLLAHQGGIGRRFDIGTAERALQPQPETDWLLRGFLARRWVSLWYGEPGCKKTWVIIDQGVCVAMGIPWLGFHAVRTTVLIVDEESGEHRLLSRLGNAMRGHDAPADIPLFYVSLHGFNLTDDRGAAELEDLIKEVKPGLVIIDAMADLMLGGDENLVKDTQPVLVRLRRIAERQDCAIEVIHHVNKAGEYRGSTALKGAVDTMLLVESRQDDSLVTFTAEKARDVIIKPFAATAHFDIGTFRLSEADPQTGQAKLSPSERYVLRYLEQNGSGTVQQIMSNADTCSPETARRAIYNLADRNAIKRSDGGGRNQEATYVCCAK
jgi:hypothetical protein